FGGLNIIFTGDFMQLKPMSALPLYSHQLLHAHNLHTTQLIKGQKAITGAFLWQQLTHAVFLQTNLCQS
ncbi:hypothetical protein DACRYDRAFT_31612, partial [Dacryopinax primogenitus]